MSTPRSGASGPRRALAGVAVLALMGAMGAPLSASADDDTFVGPGSPAPESKIHDGTVVDAEFAPHAYFVQLSEPTTSQGGSLNAIQGERERFLTDARAAGVEVEVRGEFDSLWNGLSVTAEATDLLALAGSDVVEAIFPVGLIDGPVRPDGSDLAPQMHTAIGMTGADRVHSELGYTGEGVRIGIIDTGVDYDHPDFGGSGTPGGTTFPTNKVAWGYDFVGDSFNANPGDTAYQPNPFPDEDPDDCQGHGTHVGGIAASDGEVTGVAPDAQLGAYRVFGCEGSTTADIMLHAMEMTLDDEMDVVNLSIGSAFSSWAEYPTAQATDALAREGVVVVASIGNSGADGLHSAGAPGVGRDTIGVGSVDNVAFIANFFIDEDENEVPFTVGTPAPEPPTEGQDTLVALAEPGTPAAQHCEPFTDEQAELIEGNVVMIQRGECTFHEKAANGQAAGAAGVLIYNNAAGMFNPSVDGTPAITIPVIATSQADGARLAQEALAEEGVTITWTADQTSAPSPTANLMSSFSSFGTMADLTFKPDLSAPGGQIYAPYPLEAGGYATLSGTSMAAPHAAGAAALLLEAEPELSVPDVKTRLQNSSEQLDLSISPAAGLEVVHRQGSGIIQIDDAILADVLLEPGLVQLGQQLAGESSTNTVTVHNYTGDEQTFDVSHAPAIATSGTANEWSYWDVSADVEHPETLTVPANGSAELTFSVTSPAVPDEMDPIYGGYLHLATGGDGGTVYSVAYGGVAHDLQDVEVLADMVDGDGNVTLELPVMATVTACEIWLGIECVDSAAGYDPVPAGHTYTMERENHPVVLIHFEHQARNMQWEVFEATDGGEKGASLGIVSEVDYTARSASRNAVTAYVWDGMVVNQDGARERVPDGDYLIEVTVTKASAWNDDRPAQTEVWTGTPFEVQWSAQTDRPTVERIIGQDRWSTASEIALNNFEPGVETVYVANGRNYPDALAGSALAGWAERPVLLTDHQHLPAATRMALQTLAPEQIVVLGGDAAVHGDVVAALEGYAPTSRLAGEDRYGTSVEVSGAFAGSDSDAVFLASGRDYPDALSAAAAAGVEGAPVLLTQPGHLPKVVRAELERLDPETVVVVGGPTAVSKAVADAADDYADEVVRLGGTDRYETAQLIAEHYFPVPTPLTYMVTGLDYPDALTTAPVAAMNNGPVLLTHRDRLPSATAGALMTLRPQHIELSGGYGAISLEVQEILEGLVYP